MIIKDIYDCLLTIGYPVKPFGTEDIEDTILYKFYPVSNDGVVSQDRLEITVISQDLKQGYTILDKVKQSLLTVGDNQFNEDILTISLNGGGALENLSTNTYHLKAYFIVTTRFRKE